ncbi:hypothetical protein K435DRAFT_801153 [Dendrothele bispora CBS 962.96]|uniref:Uncharacterized protein n=1 Tax=Dendrothele bispora (strain CBS 962.96) TaxID=1314807 RepID=A0A4S8LQ41_DENBC|nr:hypothetical protein K435DRAFT_801153 [Dendrothele bispora CBS 962.96]
MRVLSVRIITALFFAATTMTTFTLPVEKPKCRSGTAKGVATAMGVSAAPAPQPEATRTLVVGTRTIEIPSAGSNPCPDPINHPTVRAMAKKDIEDVKEWYESWYIWSVVIKLL